jgi:hypothetical protein
VPGDGGFFGGAGSGLGTRARRLASNAFRDCDLVGFLTAVSFGAGFKREGLFATIALRLLESAAAFFFPVTFLVTTFLIGRLLSFLEAIIGLFFLACGSFFPAAAFFTLGAAVILPGRFGFLEGDFLPLVARIF